MNLSELQAECGRLLSDPENTRWTASVLLKRLNIFQKEIQGVTKAIKTPKEYAVVASQGAALLDDDTMDVYSAFITDASSTSFPIFGTTTTHLDIQTPGWREWGEGVPRCFVYNATTQIMGIYPTNSEALTLHTIEIIAPDDLVNPTDIPFDSNNQMIPYHMALVHPVVAQCWMDDGTPEALAKSAFHKSGNMDRPGQYELHLKRIKAFFDINVDTRNRIHWKPQGGRVGQYGMPTKTYPFRG